MSINQMETENQEHMEEAFATVPGSSHPIKDMLHQVERQVTQLFKDAQKMIEDRDSLLETLYVLQNEESIEDLSASDRELVSASCETLVARCLHVDVSLSSDRGPDEELALHMVNNRIDKLVTTAHDSPTEARAACCRLLDSLAAGAGGDGTAAGAVRDAEFEQLVAGCSDGDREVLRRRLGGLLRYIEAIMAEPLEIQ